MINIRGNKPVLVMQPGTVISLMLKPAITYDNVFARRLKLYHWVFGTKAAVLTTALKSTTTSGFGFSSTTMVSLVHDQNRIKAKAGILYKTLRVMV